MPRIDVYRKPAFISDNVIKILTGALRIAAARLLGNHPIITMEPDHIRVHVTDAHPLDDNTCDVRIAVSVKSNPDRLARVLTIRGELAEVAQAILPPLVGDPARPIDSWITIDLGDKFGQTIWP